MSPYQYEKDHFMQPRVQQARPPQQLSMSLNGTGDASVKDEESQGDVSNDQDEEEEAAATETQSKKPKTKKSGKKTPVSGKQKRRFAPPKQVAASVDDEDEGVPPEGIRQPSQGDQLEDDELPTIMSLYKGKALTQQQTAAMKATIKRVRDKINKHIDKDPEDRDHLEMCDKINQGDWFRTYAELGPGKMTGKPPSFKKNTINNEESFE